MEKIPTKKIDGKTLFQVFADFLALDKGDRDAKYQVTASDSALVIIRKNAEK